MAIGASPAEAPHIALSVEAWTGCRPREGPRPGVRPREACDADVPPWECRRPEFPPGVAGPDVRPQGLDKARPQPKEITPIRLPAQMEGRATRLPAGRLLFVSRNDSARALLEFGVSA